MLIFFLLQETLHCLHSCLSHSVWLLVPWPARSGSESMSCSKRIEYCGLLSVATTSGIPCHANKDFELLTIKTEMMLTNDDGKMRTGAVAQWLQLTNGHRSLRPLGNFGNFLYPTLPVSFGRDTKSRRSLLFRGSKRSHTGGKCVTCRRHHILPVDNVFTMLITTLQQFISPFVNWYNVIPTSSVMQYLLCSTSTTHTVFLCCSRTSCLGVHYTVPTGQDWPSTPSPRLYLFGSLSPWNCCAPRRLTTK